MESQHRSVYKRGADDGFLFGGYLSALALCICGSPYVPWLAIPALAMMIFVPVVIYRFLRRSYVRDFGLSSFSELWLQGIITFVCGTLLMAATAYIFIRFIKPDFVIDQVKTAAGLYRTMADPQARQMAHTLDLMIERHLVPAPIYVVVEMMLMGIFTGSILSMFITWIVRRRKVHTRLDDVNTGK